MKSKGGTKKSKGKGKAKHVESDESSSESSSDNKSERKHKARRKAKYVELDDDPSHEEFEGYDDSSEDDNDDDKEEQSGGLEGVKWGPPSGPKGRPAIHLHTQLGEPGGSGLSARAKERMAKSTSTNFWHAGGAEGQKPKISLGTPLHDDEIWMNKLFGDGDRKSTSGDVEMAPPDRLKPAERAIPDIFVLADSSSSEILAPADIHPGSPAACKATARDRFNYLKKLSGNTHYSKLLDLIIDIEEVCFR